MDKLSKFERYVLAMVVETPGMQSYGPVYERLMLKGLITTVDGVHYTPTLKGIEVLKIAEEAEEVKV